MGKKGDKTRENIRNAPLLYLTLSSQRFYDERHL